MLFTYIVAIIGALSLQDVHALDVDMDIDTVLGTSKSGTTNFIESIPKCASECFDVQFYETDECDYDDMACHCRWETRNSEEGELIYRVLDCINGECEDRPEDLQNVTKQFEKACKASGVDFEMTIPDHEWERVVEKIENTGGQIMETGNGMIDAVAEPYEVMNPGGFAVGPRLASRSAASDAPKEKRTRKHPRSFLWPDNPTANDIQASDTTLAEPKSKRGIWWWPWPKPEGGKAVDGIDENDLDEDGVDDADEFDINQGPSLINDHRPSLLDLPRKQYPGEPTKDDIIDWVNENDLIMVNDLLPKNPKPNSPNPNSGSDAAHALVDWPFIEPNHSSGAAILSDLLPKYPKSNADTVRRSIEEEEFTDPHGDEEIDPVKEVDTESPVHSFPGEAKALLAVGYDVGRKAAFRDEDGEMYVWEFVEMPDKFKKVSELPVEASRKEKRGAEEATDLDDGTFEDIDSVKEVSTEPLVESYPGEANALREAGSLRVGKKAGFRAEDGKMYVWEFVEEPDKFKKVTEEAVKVSRKEKRDDSDEGSMESEGDVENSDDAEEGTVESKEDVEYSDDAEEGSSETENDAEYTEPSDEETLESILESEGDPHHRKDPMSYHFPEVAEALNKVGLLRIGTTSVFRDDGGKMHEWEFVEYPAKFKPITKKPVLANRKRDDQDDKMIQQYDGEFKYSAFSIQQVFPDEAKAINEAGLLRLKMRAVFPDYNGKMSVWRLVDYPDKFKKVTEAMFEEDEAGHYDEDGNWQPHNHDHSYRKRAEGDDTDAASSVHVFPGVAEALGPRFDVGKKVAFRDADGKMYVWRFVSKPDKFEKLSDEPVSETSTKLKRARRWVA